MCVILNKGFTFQGLVSVSFCEGLLTVSIECSSKLSDLGLINSSKLNVSNVHKAEVYYMMKV